MSLFSVPRVVVSVTVMMATASAAVAATPQTEDAPSRPDAYTGDTDVHKMRGVIRTDRVTLRRSIEAAAERVELEARRDNAQRAAAAEAVALKKRADAEARALAERKAAAEASKKRRQEALAQKRTSDRASEALRVALEQRGKPYVWGAAGPSSFDCSGLMQYAYGRAGLSLPRTTWDQIKAGRRVPVSAARPGDLVFYRSAAHVGMYMSGGKVVHAPRPGRDVTVQSLHAMPVYAVVRPA
ncbi:NlpC/P60 family protein [Streptomyces sp. NPDC000410]|uniref:C40 family peptidase n=1 Tax=Streptomyces sp. NPDC000410 TaxID=3154254 RepID=UPI0033225A8E